MLKQLLKMFFRSLTLAEPPWINKDLASAIRKKRTLWKRVKFSQNQQPKEKFRKTRQSIKNWIRRERKMYLQKIANEASSNPKRFWSYYSFRNKRNPIPDKVDYRGTSITDDLARAEAFNDHFKSIFKDHANCTFPDTTPICSYIPDLLEVIQVSSEEVVSLLSQLDTSKLLVQTNFLQ